MFDKGVKRKCLKIFRYFLLMIPIFIGYTDYFMVVDHCH
jgi:hypothetical protein